MAGVGGYQAPARPAPASGPGALSQRTDSQQPVRAPSGMPYGERQQLEETQRQAPLPQGVMPPSAADGGPNANTLTPLDAPTQYPGQPVTAGVDVGAGPGSEAVDAIRRGSQTRASDIIYKYAAIDTTGFIADMALELKNRGV